MAGPNRAGVAGSLRAAERAQGTGWRSLSVQRTEAAAVPLCALGAAQDRGDGSRRSEVAAGHQTPAHREIPGGRCPVHCSPQAGHEARQPEPLPQMSRGSS
jgi:hypothetical protein